MVPQACYQDYSTWLKRCLWLILIILRSLPELLLSRELEGFRQKRSFHISARLPLFLPHVLHPQNIILVLDNNFLGQYLQWWILQLRYSYEETTILSFYLWKTTVPSGAPCYCFQANCSYFLIMCSQRIWSWGKWLLLETPKLPSSFWGPLRQ